MINEPNAGPLTGPLFAWGPVSAQEPTVKEALEPLLAGPGPSLRILVAGGTGFVGRHLVLRLLRRGHSLRAVARHSPPEDWEGEVEWFPVDVTEASTLRHVADDIDVVVHLVGTAGPDPERRYWRIHVDGTGHLLATARRAGVDRFVFISTLGASPAGGPYFRTKHVAERLVRNSGLDFVIFRPSIIYGPGDHFTTALVELLTRLPVFPVLGFSRSRLQPVAIEDVADALVQAVERPDIARRTFEIAGPERLEFAKIVRIVARAAGLRRPVVKLPRSMSRLALSVAAHLGLPQPITPDQLAMFRGASVLRKRSNPLRTVFYLEPLTFAAAVEDYL